MNCKHCNGIMHIIQVSKDEYEEYCLDCGFLIN
jgi:hypothetical protein